MIKIYYEQFQHSSAEIIPVFCSPCFIVSLILNFWIFCAVASQQHPTCTGQVLFICFKLFNKYANIARPKKLMPYKQYQHKNGYCRCIEILLNIFMVIFVGRFRNLDYMWLHCCIIFAKFFFVLYAIKKHFSLTIYSSFYS